MPTKKNNRRNGGRKSILNNNNSRITQDGIRFLKCAFAPVDFNNEVPTPIPDASGARVVVKRHKLVTAIQSAAFTDTYICVPPVPGAAYYFMQVTAGTVPNGTTPFAQIKYADSVALMPPTLCGTNFAKFRYISSYFELVPTINATSWSGSVAAWKGYTSIEAGSSSSNTAMSQYVQGMLASTAPQESMYVAGNNLGMYITAAMYGPPIYRDVIDNLTNPPQNNTSTEPQLTGDMTGIGDMETIFIKLTGEFSYSIKVGCCVEYVVNTNSAIYEYSRMNDCYDPYALAVYKQVASQLPLAVSYYENPDFWKRVLAILAKVGIAAGSVLPGPVGMIAGGSGMALGGISMLM